MSQISRLKDTEISNGNLINADDIDTELNQLLSESNSQDSRLTSIESGAVTLTGVKTFSTNPKMNGIDENVTGFGVMISSTRFYHGFGNLASVRATIASVDIATDVITTTVAHNATTGEVVKVRAEKGATLDTGLSESISYYIRALSATAFTLHLTGIDASLGTNVVDIIAIGTGIRHLIGVPINLRESDIWFDGEGIKACLGGNIKTLATTSGATYPTGYHGSAPPVYASSTSFSVAFIRERDSADTINITKQASTTVDITMVGLNGIAQSSNLSGTVSVASGSAAVTFSSSQSGILQIGDVITTTGGQSRRLLSGSGTAWTAESNWSTTESTVSFKRGGRSPNTWLNLYAITDGVTVGLILSTRNVAGGDTLVDLPSGYSAWRQLAFAVRLNSSRNLIAFRVGSGWPNMPQILWNTDSSFLNGGSYTASTLTILSGGTASTWTAVSLASLVPPVSKKALLQPDTSGPAAFQIRPTGETHNGWGSLFAPSGSSVLGQMFILTNGAQSIDYQRTFSTGNLSLDVLGFEVTEVP